MTTSKINMVEITTQMSLGFKNAGKAVAEMYRWTSITTALMQHADPLTSSAFNGGWPGEPTPIYDSISKGD